MDANPVMALALGLAGLCGAMALVLVFLQRPQWAMATWTAALFFTPVWLGVQAGMFVTALTGVTIVAILSGLGAGIRWSHIDTIVLIFFFTLVAGLFIGGAVWGHVQESLVVWLLPYIWGRLVLGRVSQEWVAVCIAVAATLAALLAIGEFVTGTNIFLSIPGAGQSVWGGQRERGGLTRAEGAFGHSIALGASLAIASAFILSLRWPVWVRTTVLAVIAVAVGLTLSRIGLVGLVLTMVLAIFFLGRYVSPLMRWLSLGLLGVAGILGLPLILDVFGQAGAEAEGSAEYRSNLLPLVNDMALLGISPARQLLPTGEDYFGSFRSIDSALILVGLRHGLVPLAILILLLVIAVVTVVTGRATPSSVALVAQIPAFATVALITQYASFVWFIGGLAVASYTLEAARATHDRRFASDLVSQD